MKLTTALAVALALGLAACGGADVGTPRPPPAQVAPLRAGEPPRLTQAFASSAPEYLFLDPDRRKKLESAFPEVDAILEEAVRKQKVVGVIVGIVIDGELAHTRAFGVTDLEKKTAPDVDTVYRIASITKSFTALTLLSLRDEGALALEDPLTRFLPEAAGLVYPTRDAGPITLRQLATHSSGLPTDGNYDYTKPNHLVSEGEVTKSLSGFALQNAPGTTFKYSNMGYGLLGIVVGRAARSSFRDAVRTRVLAPLGMKSTYWDRADVPEGKLATAYGRWTGAETHPVEPWRYGAVEGGGGMYTSLRDMARYVAFQLDAYPPRNGPEAGLPKRSTVREAHSIGVDSGLRLSLVDDPRKGDSLVDLAADHYAFGWNATRTCDFEDLVWHDGGTDGFSADVHMLPQRGVGIALLSNLYRWDRAPRETVRKMLHALARTGALARRSPRVPAKFESAMKTFLGVYNAWNEGAYRAMVTKGHDQRESPAQAMIEEKEELATYKTLHGACASYAPVEMESPVGWRFEMHCEHGSLLMLIRLATDDGLISGFAGTSRGVPLPPEVRNATDWLLALLGKWDDGIYKKHLARTKPRDETVAYFQTLRWAHGACTVKTPTHEWDGWRVLLDCERGGALSLALTLDPKDSGVVASYELQKRGDAICPVR